MIASVRVVRSIAVVVVLFFGAAGLWLNCPAKAQAHVLERASLADDESQADHDSSYRAAISANGRFVVFVSGAANLVPDDTNGFYDVFVRDRQNGTTERVSVASDGSQGNDHSGLSGVSIGADGRYVVFGSEALNLLAPSDEAGMGVIYLRDRQNGTTTRVSETPAGALPDGSSWDPSISADGRYVAFVSSAGDIVAGDTNGANDVFVRDLQEETTERVSLTNGGQQADGHSWACAISGDGLSVAFQSSATNLVVGDTNARDDIFVRDIQAGTTVRASVSNNEYPSNDGSYDPAISADGRYVAFPSDASNLVSGDTNYRRDAFVRDLVAGTTVRASVSSSEAQGNLSSGSRSISADGRYVAFLSFASNLVPGDTNGLEDVFVRDLVAGTTTRVNTSGSGTQANGATWMSAALSADGTCVVFESEASNLVAGDTNGVSDIMVAANRLEPVVYTSLRGDDRYWTAIKVAQAMFPAPLPAGSGLVLAPGESYQEALCGGPLAAAYGGPVLLTPKTILISAVRNEILRLAPDRVFCIGLSDTIVTAVQTALDSLGAGRTATAIRGGNGCVYDMSQQVASALADKVGDMTGAVAIITRGDVFPDAIGVSPLACSKRWPILLTGSISGPLWADAAEALTELGITKALKLGTYCALPGSVHGLANLSGRDRYETNRNVARWGVANAGLGYTHAGVATGDKFPDALAAGPYLALDEGLLLLSPLAGPLPPVIAAELGTNAHAVTRLSYLAMIEPVVSQVKALLQ
jgi:Tol biopolymer transport system component/putative cell wall-binding protein